MASGPPLVEIPSKGPSTELVAISQALYGVIHSPCRTRVSALKLKGSFPIVIWTMMIQTTLRKWQQKIHTVYTTIVPCLDQPSNEWIKIESKKYEGPDRPKASVPVINLCTPYFVQIDRTLTPKKEQTFHCIISEPHTPILDSFTRRACPYRCQVCTAELVCVRHSPASYLAQGHPDL